MEDCEKVQAHEEGNNSLKKKQCIQEHAENKLLNKKMNWYLSVDIVLLLRLQKKTIS